MSTLVLVAIGLALLVSIMIWAKRRSQVAVVIPTTTTIVADLPTTTGAVASVVAAGVPAELATDLITFCHRNAELGLTPLECQSLSYTQNPALSQYLPSMYPWYQQNVFEPFYLSGGYPGYNTGYYNNGYYGGNNYYGRGGYYGGGRGGWGHGGRGGGHRGSGGHGRR